MKNVFSPLICAALLAGAACFSAPAAWAGSCCGGGAAAALVLPKFAQSMIDTSLDIEKYDGYWAKDGKYKTDQPGTDLSQYRLNLGYALRLAKRWQTSVSVPYVWNVNKYPNNTSRFDSIGDTTFSLWYEASDAAMCRMGWGDISLSDLVPAVTFGLSLTVPTGVSPYDGVKNDDITGRGFYRLDANVLLDKTVYPWSASLFLGYGKHFERPVNREVDYVKPYRKQLGDRAVGTLAISYETLIDSSLSRNRLTYTATLSEVWEGEGTIDGERDRTTGLQKSSVGGTVAYSTLERTWIVKLSWNHAIKRTGWGENFPASDIYSVGVTHAFR
jgi:hypothetical protein